jgi:hypothetical protein
MGDGFVILQSGNVDMYYYSDEPGKGTVPFVLSGYLFDI